ncbi:pseudouridine synthase [Algoriphagus namhaensis]|uniref:Pseudouridine synthase n=1 Tax=Algoriphagus namhaensis TaxID=915353 RepID=A0ABV8APQ8_9BACT
MKNPKKQFFQSSEESPRRDEGKQEGRKPKASTGNDSKLFSKKGKYDDQKSFSKDKGFGKGKKYPKSKEEQAAEKTYYQGRSKGEKPVFGTTKPTRFEGNKEKRGFGAKRRTNINPDVERPDYNFEAVPSKKQDSEEHEFRLNKYIANSGICSRREADSLIKKGLITVNGEIITEMGFKVKKSDRVIYQGKKINPEKPVYILLNKPKDFITTTDDPMERKTVMNLVKNACEERIFPVGRLDRNTTGLLFFTNDGELAAKLSHPSNQVKKIYQVTLDKPLTQKDEEAVRDGLTLEDGLAPVDDIQVLSLDRKILGLQIHIGRNRIVRRIFAHLGYEVTALDRVMYAGLDKKDLKRGNYRFLSEKEVIRLKYFI